MFSSISDGCICCEYLYLWDGNGMEEVEGVVLCLVASE